MNWFLSKTAGSVWTWADINQIIPISFFRQITRLKPELIPIHKCSSSPEEECHLKFSPNTDVPEDKPLIKRFCLREDSEDNLVENSVEKEDFKISPLIPKARKLEISQDIEVPNSIPIEYPAKDIKPLDVFPLELKADGSDTEVSTIQAPADTTLDEELLAVDEEDLLSTVDTEYVTDSILDVDEYLLQDVISATLDTLDETTIFNEPHEDEITTVVPLDANFSENVTIQVPERKERKVTKSTSYSVSVVQPPLTSYSIGPIGGAK